MLTARQRENIRRRVRKLTVDSGGHDTWDDGHCIMEIVNRVTTCHTVRVLGEEKESEFDNSDSPDSSCTFATGLMISINDAISDRNRQLLLKLVPWLAGSNDKWMPKRANSVVRARWLVRTFAAYAANERNDDTFCEISHLIKTNDFKEASSLAATGKQSIHREFATVINSSILSDKFTGSGAFLGEWLTKHFKNGKGGEAKFVEDFIRIVKKSLTNNLPKKFVP